MLHGFEIAISPSVIVFTVLLTLCASYWLLVILGFLGLEFLDFDFEVDPDFDAGMEGDATAAADGWGVQALKFFHFGEVPFMVILTFFALIMWTTTYFTTYFLSDWEYAPWLMFAMIGPNLLVTLVITHFVLLPFRTLFRSLNSDAAKAQTKIVGQICLITTSEVTDRFGQAEIAQDGPPIVIDVRCKKGEFLRKGDAGLVESYDKEDNSYWVVPKKREV